MSAAQDRLNRIFDEEMTKLGVDLRGLPRQQAVPVLATALNKIGRKARTRVVRAVAADLKVRNKDVDKRVPKKFSRATFSRLRVILTGLTQPMSIAQLITGKKGKMVYRNRLNRSGKEIPSKKAGAGMGGIRVGKLYFADAYVNVIRKNQAVHVMRRKQRATWIGKTRAPVEVLKLELQPTIDRRMNTEVDKVLASDWEKEFDAAYRYHQDKAL